MIHIDLVIVAETFVNGPDRAAPHSIESGVQKQHEVIVKNMNMKLRKGK